MLCKFPSPIVAFMIDVAKLTPSFFVLFSLGRTFKNLISRFFNQLFGVIILQWLFCFGNGRFKVGIPFNTSNPVNDRRNCRLAASKRRPSTNKIH